MKRSYLCNIGKEENYIEANNEVNACCEALKIFIEEQEDQLHLPCFIEVKEEQKESVFYFTPTILADLGMHKLSSLMLKEIEVLTSGKCYA